MDNNIENEYLKKIIELEIEVKNRVSKKVSDRDESIFRKIFEHSKNVF